jgi:anti-anti-sigma factor
MSDAMGEVRVTHYDSDSNGTWIIALAGEHDLATAPLIDALTVDIWPRCSVALVDLRAATFIDSSVVNWLVRARRTLEAQGSGDAVRIVVDSQGRAVDLVFDALGLRDDFACYATLQSAVAQAPADRLVAPERSQRSPAARGRHPEISEPGSETLREIRGSQ